MIRIDQADFSFGGKPILDGASLFLPEGSRAALLGRNGAGKTTLFHLLLGELGLDSGRIEIARDRTLAFLPQHPAAPSAATILRHVLESHPTLHNLEEEILRLEGRMVAEVDPARLDRLVERHRGLSREFEAQGGYELEARVSAILEGLGFSRQDLLREIAQLSPGEKNRVAIAKVLLAEADILLLDEPTNHLDFGMVEWLEEFLRAPPVAAGGRRVTVLVASHDRWFINRFADHTVELRRGRLFLYGGAYDDFARQRAEELERQEKEYRLQQQEIEKDEEFVRRNFAAQKARQAKSREKKLARMEVFDRPEREGQGPRLRFSTVARAGEVVLRLEDVSCGYERALISGVRLELPRGEKVAIVGPNGCGKTTLLKCIVGRLRPLAGEVLLGQRTVVGYYEQEHVKEGSDRNLFDEVHDLVPRWSNQEVRDLLAAFLFRGDEVFLRTAALSGGEKARLALLRLIISGANLLVLDEPTNHLDIYARAALEESLLAFPETILFVSHDRYFIERVADRVLGFHQGRLWEFFGGYEEYRSVGRKSALAEKEAGAEARRQDSRTGGPPRAGTAARTKKEEEKLMGEIARAEVALKLKHEECGLEVTYRNPEAMRRLKQETTDLEGRLAELYRKWEGGFS